MSLDRFIRDSRVGKLWWCWKPQLPLSLVVQECLLSSSKPKIIQHICITSRCGGQPTSAQPARAGDGLRK